MIKVGEEQIEGIREGVEEVQDLEHILSQVPEDTPVYFKLDDEFVDLNASLVYKNSESKATKLVLKFK